MGASYFAHTQACGLVLLGTTQNMWADPLTPTRVAVIGVPDYMLAKLNRIYEAFVMELKEEKGETIRLYVGLIIWDS